MATRKEFSIRDLDRTQTQPFPSQAQVTWLVFALAIFFCLTVLVVARYPFVWTDEVVYTDPAVNFVNGHGFASTAWYTQESGAFWTGNVPMYSFLLVPWLKLFGISIRSVRSMSGFFFSAFLLLSLVSGIRLRLVSDRTSRLCFLGALAGGYGMIFCNGDGRPDSLGMLLVGSYMFLYGVRTTWIRLSGFFLAGFVAPWIGFQLLPFQAVTGVVLWSFLGRAFFPLLAAAGLGSVVGLFGLWLLYSHFGVLVSFMRSIQPDTGAFIQSLLSGVMEHRNLLPKDFSLFPMLLGAIAILVLLRHKHEKRLLRSPLFVCVLIAISVSLALVLFGRFPTYYSWMAYVPLALGVCHSIGVSARGTSVWRIGVAACILSGSIGVSLHALNLFGCWSDRSYCNVERLVSQSVFPDEDVYAEYAAYYALHPITRRAYYPSYLGVMTEDEKARLEVLISYPYNLARVTHEVGGQWEPTGQKFTPRSDGFFGSRGALGYLSLPNYGLAVYRRVRTSVPRREAGQ